MGYVYTMSYHQTPEEYLIHVISTAGIHKNWVATLVMAITNSGVKGVGPHIPEIQYKSDPGFANIRSAYNWALNWSKGNPPGGSGGTGKPEDVRVQWLELIYKNYDPAKDIKPKAKKGAKKASKKSIKKAPAKASKLEEKTKRRKGDPMTSEEAAQMGIKGQSSSIDPADGVEPGDYSDVQSMMNRGEI